MPGDRTTGLEDVVVPMQKREQADRCKLLGALYTVRTWAWQYTRGMEPKGLAAGSAYSQHGASAVITWAYAFEARQLGRVGTAIIGLRSLLPSAWLGSA